MVLCSEFPIMHCIELDKSLAPYLVSVTLTPCHKVLDGYPEGSVDNGNSWYIEKVP